MTIPLHLLRFGFVLLAAGIPAHAADIQWRGAPFAEWHDKENWELPDDIPPGTPPDQAERLRRVPNFNDRAIIAPGSGLVRVVENTLVGGLRLRDRAALNIAAGVTFEVTSARFEVEADPDTELSLSEGAQVVLQRPARLGRVRIFGGQLRCNDNSTVFAGEVVLHSGTLLVSGILSHPVQFPGGLTVLENTDTNAPSFNRRSRFQGYGLFDGSRLRVEAAEFELDGQLDFEGGGRLDVGRMQVLRGGPLLGRQNLLRFGENAFIQRGASPHCLLESQVEFHGEICGLDQMGTSTATLIEFLQEVLATGPAQLHAPWRLSPPARMRLVNPGCFLAGAVRTAGGQQFIEVGEVMEGATLEIKEGVVVEGLRLDGGSLIRSADALPGLRPIEVAGFGGRAGLLQVASGQLGGSLGGSPMALQITVRNNATLRFGGSRVDPVAVARGHIRNLPTLVNRLRAPADALTAYLRSQLLDSTLRFLDEYRGPGTISVQVEEALMDDFNLLIRLDAVHDPEAFAGVTLRPETQELLAANPQGAERRRLNRMLLEDALPNLLAHIPPGPVRLLPPLVHLPRVENQGRVDFEFDPARLDFAPRVNCLLGNQPGGVVSLASGQSFDPLASPNIVNRGRIEILKPSIGDSAGRRSRVANTLINDAGGRVVVEAGAEMEFSQGENRAGGRFELGAEGLVTVAFGLLSDTFRYRPFKDDGTEGDEVTVNLGRLFHFRAGGAWTGEADHGLQLIGGPGALATGFGGVSVEEPLEVDRFIVGGPESHLPRFVAGPGPAGPALTVRKVFRWLGGRLEGNGVGNARGTRSLEVGPDAQWFLGPEAQPGNTAILASGLILNTRGRGSIETPHRITLNTGTLWHLHSGSITALERTDALGIAGDFFNEGRLNKTREPLLLLGNNVRIAGELHVLAGTLRGQGTARFTGEVFLDDANALLHAQGCVLAGARIFGPGRLLTTGGARFEEIVEADRVQWGEPGTLPESLTSGPAARMIVFQELRWLGGGIRLDSSGRVLLQVGAVGEFRNEHPAALVWSRGNFENFGTLTYVADSPGPLAAAAGVNFVNQAAGRWIVRGPGQVLLPALGGPGPLPPAPAAFENRGEVAFELPEEGEAEVLWHPPVQHAAGRVRFARDGGAPPRAKLRFMNNYLQTGGVFESAHADVNFERTFDLRGGRVLLGTGTSALAAGAATVRGAGSVLDVGPLADFIPGSGLTLLDQGILSGRGTVVGNVANVSGLVDPGLNEALVEFGTLSIHGDVAFGSAAVLAADLPVNVAEPVGDRLMVTGQATLAGSVRVTPLFSPLAVSTGAFIELLRAGSLTGSFGPILAPPLEGGRRFEGQVREGPARFGLQLVGDASAADLAVTAEAPLTAPAGAGVAHTFTVMNRGPDPANGVTLAVVMPVNAALVGSEPSGTVTDGTLTIPLPNLAKDASALVRLRWNAPAVDSALAVAATVSSQTNDPALENNTTRVTTAVLVGGTFTIGRFELTSAGRLKLTFETLPGVRYRLERSTDLVNWVPHREILGDGTERTFDDLGGEGREPEFFRLVIL
ncbi:MAG: DUF11 domain-containing protein [Verrucomicrobia bacterium]|nr:DUF11 domain-containing protein [Verrucomicrobiota bacterium]